MPLREQRSSVDDYQQGSRVQFANNQDTFETDPSPAAPDRRWGTRNSGGTAHKYTPFGTLRSETHTLKDGSVVPRLFPAPPDNLEFHNASSPYHKVKHSESMRLASMREVSMGTIDDTDRYASSPLARMLTHTQESMRHLVGLEPTERELAEERKAFEQWPHDAPPDTQLHVRGVGVEGWDGTPQGHGVYETPSELMALFEPYGGCRHVYVRHRISADSKVNTSWALVTMETVAGARLAIEEGVERKIRAGDTVLDVTLFDPHMANQSKGRMGQLMSNKERDQLKREIDDSMARKVCGLRFTSRVIFVLYLGVCGLVFALLIWVATSTG